MNKKYLRNSKRNNIRTQQTGISLIFSLILFTTLAFNSSRTQGLTILYLERTTITVRAFLMPSSNILSTRLSPGYVSLSYIQVSIPFEFNFVAKNGL